MNKTETVNEIKNLFSEHYDLVRAIEAIQVRGVMVIHAAYPSLEECNNTQLSSSDETYMIIINALLSKANMTRNKIIEMTHNLPTYEQKPSSTTQSPPSQPSTEQKIKTNKENS